jgi:hypothetical protein
MFMVFLDAPGDFDSSGCLVGFLDEIWYEMVVLIIEYKIICNEGFDYFFARCVDFVIDFIALGLGIFAQPRTNVLTWDNNIEKGILLGVDRVRCLSCLVEFCEDFVVKWAMLASYIFFLAKVIDENGWHIIGDQQFDLWIKSPKLI